MVFESTPDRKDVVRSVYLINIPARPGSDSGSNCKVICCGDKDRIQRGATFRDTPHMKINTISVVVRRVIPTR